MKLLTNGLQKSYENAKIYYICKEKFEDESYCTVRDHCYFTWEYRGAAHSICNLKYGIPNEISIDSHSGLNYDYHFIIK